jgi:NAD(P)-dependent dehydrogenase (short-subunit alcohol dehydrogenase family)
MECHDALHRGVGQCLAGDAGERTMSDYRKLFALDGKVAVITGGAGILGARFARGLAEFGARVAIVDIDEPAAVALADAISGGYGTESCGVFCDVTDPASVDAMVADVVARFGAIDILHNNAASKGRDLEAFFAPYEDYALATWREVMAVNLDGMFLVSQGVGRQMIRQGRGGSIIQTSSIYGILGADKRLYEGSRYLEREINTPAVYAASKAAVIGLGRYLATHWAEHGIRVNTLTPGGVASGQNEVFAERYGARVPLARMAAADELVAALVFLASDASSYVTGHNLIVDGGLSAW